MDDSQPDFEKLPIEERLQHKVWKARLSAYEALINEFRLSASESDACFRPYLGNPDLLKKAALDSNAVAQEKAVAAICAFVQYGGTATSKTREVVMPAVVEKCLGSTRAGTKGHALELALQYTEAAGSAEGVVTDVIAGLKAKQPKLVAGCVSTLKELIKNFGPKVTPLQLVLKQLSTIFAHADKTVRAEGFALVQEAYRYAGQTVETFFTDLKPVQVKELQESFADMDAKGDGKGTAKQLRLTKDQQREAAIREAESALGGAENASANEDQGAPEEEAFDSDSLVEAVDLRKKLPAGFFDHLASTKWKERKEEALDPLLTTLTSTPKLSEEDYTDILAALAKRMTDANVACVTVAAQCIAGIANGLKSGFARYKSTVVPPLLERLKEKKQSVVDALAAALDATGRSVPISDFLDDFGTFAVHKNPQVKCETFKFIVRCLKETKTAPSPNDTKNLASVQLKGMEDSFEPVRAAAMEGLGTLAKIVGERPLVKELEGLDDIKKGRVKEYMEKAEVKAKSGIKAAPAPRPNPSLAPSAAPPAKTTQPPKPKTKPAPPSSQPSQSASPPPVRPPPKKPAAPAVSASTAAAPKKVAPAGAAKAAPKAVAVNSEPLRYRMTQEDAESQAQNVLPPEVIADLPSSNWKSRLAAMEALQSWVEGQMESLEPELVVRVFSKTPGWKESNFQVFNKVLGVSLLLAEQSPSWSKGCAAIVIPPASEKLGDIKIKKSASELLLALAEKSSLQFVLSQAYDPMSKLKAPKALADAIAWVDQALRDFGSAGLAVKDMIEFLKTGLKSSNPAVRTSATKTITTLKLYIGAAVKDFVQDLNPQLLSTIEKEFARVEGETPPEPTRTSADLAVSVGAGGSSGAGDGPAQDPMDELYPRVDLDKILSSSLLTACNDPNWKTRKESMEQVQGALESNKRYKPGIGGIGAVLKMRLADSNKVVQGLALDVINRIASGMNQPFDKHVKTLAPPVMQILADQKASIRTAAASTLTSIADACGLETLVGPSGSALETPNPVLRKDLLNWLEERLASTDTSLNLIPLTAPLLSCLEDRSADVRKVATALLTRLVESAGYDHVADKVSSLKPASRSLVTPILENAANATGPRTTSAPPSAPLPVAAVKKPTAPTSNSTKLTASASEPPSKLARSGNPSLAASLSRPTSAAGKALKSAAPAHRPATPTQATPSNAAHASTARPRAGPSMLKRPVSTAPPRVPAANLSSSAVKAVPELPLKTTDNKFKPLRASKEVGPLRWSIDGIARLEQVEALHHQMGPHASEALLNQLFSKDHHCEKDFLAALTTLDECAVDPSQAAASYDTSEEDLSAALLANIDLIFKYLSIRLADSGTTIIIKCLDLIEHLLSLSASQACFLSDYEAQCIVPSLVGKLGDAKEPLRARAKTLLRSFCNVYPASKVWTAIMDHGVKAKNARTRAESADELGVLIQRHGESVLQPGKALPALGSLVADRDSSARSAAISTIAIVYNLHGDLIFDYLGGLSAKDRGMLDEKLKRTAAAPTSPDRPSTPSSKVPAASARKSLRPASSRLSLGGASGIPPGLKSTNGPASHGKEAPRQLAPAPTISETKPRRSLIPPSTSKHSHLTPAPIKEAPVEEAPAPVSFNQIVNQNPVSSVDALKTVQKDIDRRASEVMPMADDLVGAVTLQMRTAFDGLDPSSSSSTLRLCKHLMQTLSAFFDNRALAKEVSRDALVSLLAELTRRLLETADNTASEAIVSLSKVLNMVLIRIFHNSERSACFGALFAVLEDVTIDLRDLEGRDLQQRSKYAELVMKCLWKISKSAKESLEDGSLDLRRLLLELDKFLTAIPPAEWRRRAADGIALGDMPLRTCKTILQQVITVFGKTALEELDKMDMTDTSFVGAYLHRLAQSNGPASTMPKQQPKPTSKSRPAHESPPEPLSPRPPADSSRPQSPPSATLSGPADREINQQLKEIFDTIGQPETSKQGITQLWEFRQEHPEAEPRIQTWIDATGKHFKAYLERAMSNISSDRGMSAPSSPAMRQSNQAGSEGPLSRKTSLATLGRGDPASPRSSMASPPPTSDRLANLQSLFGYGHTQGGA